MKKLTLLLILLCGAFFIITYNSTALSISYNDSFNLSAFSFLGTTSLSSQFTQISQFRSGSIPGISTSFYSHLFPGGGSYNLFKNTPTYPSQFTYPYSSPWQTSLFPKFPKPIWGPS